MLNSFGTLTLVQTLVSGNSVSSRGAEIYHYSGEASAAIIANGSNLFGHDGDVGTGGFEPGVTDIVPAVPLSGILDPALADNGGPTKTHTLVTGSPAIDAVPAASCATTGDQGGVTRPQDGDRDTVTDCDIGALETRIPAPAPPGATPANRKPRLRCTRSVCRIPPSRVVGPAIRPPPSIGRRSCAEHASQPGALCFTGARSRLAPKQSRRGGHDDT